MPFFALVFSLLGIVLGSDPTDLRAKLGDPLLIEQTSKLSRTADFLRFDDPSAVLRVTERDGVVFAVEIERERGEPKPGVGDSYGVVLGMSRAEVRAKRGAPAFETVNTLFYPEDTSEDASFIYRFDGDTLEAIKLLGSGASAAGDSSLPHITEPAAASYTTAVLDFSPSVALSDHFREQYLTVHGCELSGRTSTVERRDKQTFVIATGSCHGKTRSFYFDITRARP